MEKAQRKAAIFSPSWWILLLLFPWLCLRVSWGNGGYRSSSEVEDSPHVSGQRTVFSGGKKQGTALNSLLSELLKGEDRKRMEEAGFACDAGAFSKHCVANGPIQIDTETMTVTVASSRGGEETVVRPYARQEDEALLQRVTPVKLLTVNSTPPICRYKHQIPAVVFSSSGFVGNVFHEINEIIIPLFITTRLFNSRVLFVAADYNPSFMRKYAAVLQALTSSDVVNPIADRSVHCFPGGVIGLKFHGHLSLNPSDVPTGHSIVDFRQFLRSSLGLNFSHVSQITRPRLLLLSRPSTRRFLNEAEIVAAMEDVGFEVIVAKRSKIVSNLNVFAKMVNSCSVFVGAHGAGLTNELFLPDGAVMVQADLIGLKWAAATYYGDPARAMGLHYLRYEIKPEESSLWKVFGRRNSSVFTDPGRGFSAQAGKEVYLNGQNVRIDVHRFRDTIVEAMSLVRDSPL